MQGWDIVYAADGVLPDVVMVVGGTKQLAWLWKMKRAGVPIVYRLDGINWLHRKTKVSARQYFLGEVRNLLSQLIRKFLSSFIVYQSQFVADWWQKKGWSAAQDFTIINNGVDLTEFHPGTIPVQKELALLCLEGTLDYTPYAVSLLNELRSRLPQDIPMRIYGGFEKEESKRQLSPEIDYRGKLARTDLPKAYRNAIYLSLDINAACPNTVAEALASGLPVVGFDTGALAELVTPSAGVIVPYGSDPWELDSPDIDALIMAVVEGLENWQSYSDGARKLAVERYDLKSITSQYLTTIENVINGMYEDR